MEQIVWLGWVLDIKLSIVAFVAVALLLYLSWSRPITCVQSFFRGSWISVDPDESTADGLVHQYYQYRSVDLTHDPSNDRNFLWGILGINNRIDHTGWGAVNGHQLPRLVLYCMQCCVLGFFDIVFASDSLVHQLGPETVKIDKWSLCFVDSGYYGDRFTQDKLIVPKI